MNKHVVGGFVRDIIIGQKPNDMDIVVEDSNIQELTALYGESIGKSFPVWLDNDGNEVALTRKERSTGSGHTDFEINCDNVTIKEDLLRRDFTINALAFEYKHLKYFIETHDTDIIIDVSTGLDDIKNGWIRHIDADAFKEDPLRVFRCARFYAKLFYHGFRIHPDTIQLCQEMVKSGMVDHLPKERIWAESLKSLNNHTFEYYIEALSLFGYMDVDLLVHSKSKPIWKSEQIFSYYAHLNTCNDFEKLYPQKSYLKYYNNYKMLCNMFGLVDFEHSEHHNILMALIFKNGLIHYDNINTFFNDYADTDYMINYCNKIFSVIHDYKDSIEKVVNDGNAKQLGINGFKESIMMECIKHVYGK